MSVSMRKFKPEQAAGLLFVLALHGVLLYGLWSYRIITAPKEASVLMVNLINPPAPEQPMPPRPQSPKPSPPRPAEPPPQQLTADAPAAQPGEPVVYVPPPPPVVDTPSPPVAEAPPLPPQPVALSGELSVSCPERSPPDYPRLSMRMNEQGKVVLRVELAEDGRVAGAEVKSGSGYPRLDAAALDTVRKWRCKPPVRNGVPVHAVALQPFNFILKE